MLLFQRFVCLCLGTLIRATFGSNCQDIDDWRSRHAGQWKVGPDRYYRMGAITKFVTWDKADESCGNYYEDSQLAVPHTGDDVHFIREHVIRAGKGGAVCVWVGKLFMTT